MMKTKPLLMTLLSLVYELGLLIASQAPVLELH